MKPVDQTRFGAPEGNCFAACVASLLELPLDEAPDLMRLVDWYAAFEEWLRPRGLYPIGFSCANEPPGWVVAGLHILSGGSPRGDFDHSVLARGAEVVHDPHPSRAGLRSLKDRILLVPLDPALFAPRSCDVTWPRVCSAVAVEHRPAPELHGGRARYCGPHAALFDAGRLADDAASRAACPRAP